MNKAEMRSLRRGFAIQILAGEGMALTDSSDDRRYVARAAVELASVLIEEIQALEEAEDIAERDAKRAAEAKAADAKAGAQTVDPH